MDANEREEWRPNIGKDGKSIQKEQEKYSGKAKMVRAIVQCSWHHFADAFQERRISP